MTARRAAAIALVPVVAGVAGVVRSWPRSGAGDLDPAVRVA